MLVVRSKLLFLASALSLLLGVAALVLWARSYCAYESVEYEISHYTLDWDWKYCTFNYSDGQFYSTTGHHFSKNLSHPESFLMSPEGRHLKFATNPPVSEMWISEKDGTLVEWHGFYARPYLRPALDQSQGSITNFFKF